MCNVDSIVCTSGVRFADKYPKVRAIVLCCVVLCCVVLRLMCVCVWVIVA
jgi:hypothetical protein